MMEYTGVKEDCDERLPTDQKYNSIIVVLVLKKTLKFPTLAFMYRRNLWRQKFRLTKFLLLGDLKFGYI